MSEVLFYHLEHRTLEQVLPSLLEKTLERGWRAVVQAMSRERLDALDTLLWNYRDDSFLAHGVSDGKLDANQPILLTVDPELNSNGSQVRFLVENATSDHVGDYDRVVYLFDGREKESVEEARERWKKLKAEGHDTTYWQQDDQGRWQKKA